MNGLICPMWRKRWSNSQNGASGWLFATLGFAGHAVTGREFVAAISRACRRDFKIDFVPWRLLKMMGLVVPVFRELTDISYLWSTPHAIDRARLTEIIGDIARTPLDRAIVASLAALGLKRRRRTNGADCDVRREL